MPRSSFHNCSPYGKPLCIPHVKTMFIPHGEPLYIPQGENLCIPHGKNMCIPHGESLCSPKVNPSMHWHIYIIVRLFVGQLVGLLNFSPLDPFVSDTKTVNKV